MTSNPWPVWLVAVIASFAALESRALRTGAFPTLSENLARWIGVHPARAHGRVMPVLFLSFWAWLTVHVVTYRGPSSN